MQEVIIQNKFYEISINKSKNRAYLKIIGFWRNTSEIADYVKDLKKALVNVKPNYTLLTDLTEMKTHPAEVQLVHMEAQNLLISKGLLRTAEVCSSSIVQFQTNTISKKSKMPLMQFSNREEAEKYLDSIKN